MELSDIKSVFVHWSESGYINDTLCADGNSDIENPVDVFAFDGIIKVAAKEVKSGYDKTCLTVVLNNGEVIEEEKFYLSGSKDSLLKLIELG